MWAMVIVRVIHWPDVFAWFQIGGDVSFIWFVLSENEQWSLHESFVGSFIWFVLSKNEQWSLHKSFVGPIG